MGAELLDRQQQDQAILRLGSQFNRTGEAIMFVLKKKTLAEFEAYLAEDRKCEREQRRKKRKKRWSQWSSPY